MPINPIEKGQGSPRAEGCCDECGRSEVFACDYERRNADWRLNVGQAHKKLSAQGWSIIGKVVRCPACEGQRKIKANLNRKAEANMKPEVVTPIRQPTREQKRQIISILDVCYDTSAERYKQAETDKTVAEAVGGGCMPGWVAEIREELYGPDGGNDEMAQLLEQMREWVEKARVEENEARSHAIQAEAALKTLKAKIEQVEAFEKRLEAVRRAVGPKAGMLA